MDTFLQDIRYALRSLRKRVVFTAIAVLTLAIGIGANSALFSVVNSALLRPLPFPEPERLVKVSLVRPDAPNFPGSDDMVWSYPKWEILRDEQRIFSRLAAYSATSHSLLGEGDPERIDGEFVSADYFALLGIRPLAGRTFTEEEERDPGKAQVALIGEGLWSRRFNRDPGIVGRNIHLAGYAGGVVTVVGIVPAHFSGLLGRAEIWTPLAAIGSEMLGERWNHYMAVVGRLAPGVTLERATSETTVLGRIVNERIPSFQAGEAWSAGVRSLDELRIDPNIRRSILVLFVAVTAVLLIACANVAGLLLARAADRRREIALRLALGAKRTRLIRQLITEAVVLAVIGGAAGVLVGALGVRALASMAREIISTLGFSAGYSVITLGSIRLDASVLLFTMGASVLTGLLFGVVPAFQATRSSLSADLKEGAAAAVGFGSIRGLSSRSALVVFEIALAFILLVGSALMVKTLANLLGTGSGIDPKNLLTLRVTLPPDYAPEQRYAFWSQLSERLATQPGVDQAGITSCPPLNGGCNATRMWRHDGPPVSPEQQPLVGVHWITPNYMETVRTPLLQGRMFSERDRADAPKVVLINQTAARTMFPGENPIGRRIGVGQGGFDSAEIVGVIGDQRFLNLETPPRADVFIPLAQTPRASGYIFLRTAAEPSALIAGVRKEVQRLDASLPVYGVMTMEERVASSTARTRITGLLLGTFAATALVLALVGIYGVIAFAVAQRTREFGLRIALGALHSNIAGLVLRYGVLVVGTGTLFGLLGAFATTRLLRTMLYEVEPTDPATFVTLALATMVVALAAIAAPAIRAMRVDPLVALKNE